jgi:hypothetical protein
MDIIVSGASRVVIGDDLNVSTIQKFLDMTEEIVMRCGTEQKAIMFHAIKGNMYCEECSKTKKVPKKSK